ncbi:MAG: MFS transporter [Rhodospirillaceae bacterium]|nr:MFS transporter [Rhodospirillaceae bacterium]
MVNFAVYGLIFVLSLYFRRLRGFSAMETGLAFVPLTAVLIASNTAAGRIAARAGPRLPMWSGLVVGAAGFALLLGLGMATSYATILPGFLLIPSGIGLAVPAMTAALLSTVGRGRAGIAAGVLNTVRQTGGALGVAVFGGLMAGPRPVAGLRTALLVSVLLLAAAAALAALGIGAGPPAPPPGRGRRGGGLASRSRSAPGRE